MISTITVRTRVIIIMKEKEGSASKHRFEFNEPESDSGHIGKRKNKMLYWVAFGLSMHLCRVWIIITVLDIIAIISDKSVCLYQNRTRLKSRNVYQSKTDYFDICDVSE